MKRLHSLDNFVVTTKEDLDMFKEAYMEKHATNPEYYPLNFEDDNAGMWAELFMLFLENGEV